MLPTGRRGYPVRSLYLETHCLQSHRDKLAGIYDRFKLRLRVYRPDEARVVVEIKRKIGQYVLKDRVQIAVEEVELIRCGRYCELLAKHPGDASCRRFAAAAASLGAVSPLVVDYQREAFQHPDYYERATLDTEFLASPSWDLLERRFGGQRFAEGFGVLEIKCTRLPRWLPELAKRHGLGPRSVSKFSLGCSVTYAHP